MNSDERLKKKCNKLIDMAQNKEKELQNLRDILYPLLEQKAEMERRLQNTIK